MGIYREMMERIGSIDLMVVIPVLAGAGACVLLLSKAFDKLFEKAFTGMYHFILGIIVASSIMIVPYNGKLLDDGIRVVSYDLPLVVICAAGCAVGIGLGYGMSLLEKKYKEN
jgi:putative membrane protein